MLKKLVVVAVAIVLAIGVGELLARGIWWARGKPYDAQLTQQMLASNRASASRKLIPGAGGRRSEDPRFFLHPFFGWEADKYYELSNAFVEQVRSGELDDVYKVVVVGGSVAGLFADPDEGAPDVLAAAIAADPRFAGREVRVFNEGRGAFKQPQQMFVLVWLFALGVTPDAVINIDGFNEVALSNQNRQYSVHPLFPSFAQWGPRLPADLTATTAELAERATIKRLEALSVTSDALARHYPWSAVLGPWALSRSNVALEQWKGAAKAYLTTLWSNETRVSGSVLGPPFHGGQREALEMAINLWRESTLDVEALCRRRGIAYLHVLQPTLHDRGSKPLTDEEIKTGEAIVEWREAVRLGYGPLRETGASLRADGFPFFDATRIFADVPETLYYDPCHFSRAGNEILARNVAEAFLELAAIR